jgi:hypothetical protein
MFYLHSFFFPVCRYFEMNKPLPGAGLPARIGEMAGLGPSLESDKMMKAQVVKEMTSL